MCGHVGLAGALELKDENTLKKLLMFDYFRGPDSTGLAVLRKNGETKVVKMASHPLNLFDSGRYKDAANAYNSRVFLGHNRAATKGVVNDYNAHPYDCGHIVGAHNGTLTQASWDKLQEMAGENTGTDSHAIFLAIAKCGIEAVVKELQGAWALVWIDKQENTLNFLRNKERPFWYATTKDHKKLLWASEHWMIRAAMSSATTAYELYQTNEGYMFFSTSENWHYRYDLDALAAGTDERPSIKAKVIERKGKEPEPVKQVGYHQNFPNRTSGSSSGGSTNTNSSGSTQTGTPSTTTSHGTQTSTATRDVSPRLMISVSSDDSSAPFGDAYPVGRFRHLAQYGCSWCHNEIELDKPFVIFDSQDKILCECCAPKIVGSKNRIYLSAQKMAQAA